MVAGCSLSPAIAAAAALLEGSAAAEADGSPRSGAGGLQGGGCLALVTFQFLHRAEWLQPGARLVLRDRGDNCTAGAGIVRAVQYGVPPHPVDDV